MKGNVIRIENMSCTCIASSMNIKNGIENNGYNIPTCV